MPEPAGIQPHANADLPKDIALVGSIDEGRPDGLDELAAALAARGHVVTVYLRSRGPRRADALVERNGYRVVMARAGPDAPLSSGDALPLMGEFAGYLNRAWERNPPNVVHAYGWLPGVASQLAARHRLLPTVQTFHGLASAAPSSAGDRLPDDASRVRLEPLLARGATWVTAGCAADLSALSRMRRARARLSLVPGGVDVERFSPVGPASTRGAPHRIVCLASTTPHLIGVTHVIRALPKLAESELVIGETGPRGTPYQRARQDLQGLAAELGVAHRLHLLGPLDPDQVPRLLRSADVVACTPHSAPEASTALKAMASGVAVVATDVGALADVVIHGVTGLLVSGDNELAAALKLLHAQPFRRQGMGAAGRVRAQSRYSWARVAVDVESVYHNVAYGAVSPDHAAQAAREVAVSRPAHRPPEQREAAVRKLRGMADQGDGDDVDGPT